MNKHILVLGSLNMDLVVRSPRHPQPGETILGGEFNTFPGGKGANQAVAAARLGASVEMIGRVGTDAFGDALLATVAKDGVSTAHILRDAAATGVALITVDAAGQNTIVVASGANARVSPQDVDAASGAFENAAALVLQLECPLPAVVRAAEAAKARRIPVILNPAPAQPLPAHLLSGVDYLIPNQTELALLSGGITDLNEAVRWQKSQNIRCLIVTLGGEGVWASDETGTHRLPAFNVTPLDTVAAGDAFVGAFAVALSEGQPLEQALRWGNAAGAISVTRAGAQPSLPTRAELEKFLREK
ncbi:MAG: ribokinase [Anaerolineaceae bacterium]